MILDVEKRKAVRWLQTAFELEWSTIPPYLMALISLRPDHNRIPAEIIRSVMIEEMLHMTLVGNVASSLSGQVQIDENRVPRYPVKMTFEGNQFKDRRFDIDLGPFSPNALNTFLKVELPAGLAPHEIAFIDQQQVPGLTIGEFYNLIMNHLRQLCDEFGESDVFSGNPEAQIGIGYYWSSEGSPVVVKSLETAIEALEEIVEQGEGGSFQESAKMRQADLESAVPHYFRFKEIETGRRYRVTDDLRMPPTGDAFEVDYSAVYPLLKNPISSDYKVGTPLAGLNDSFNRAYTLMLKQMREAFNGQPRTLYTAIMDGMQTLTSIASQMIITPIPGMEVNGTPSFEWLEP